MTCACRPETALFDFIGQQIAVLWKGWSRKMHVRSLAKQNEFSMSGDCPHCDHASVFLMVTNAHVAEEIHNERGQPTAYELWAAMQCQGCLRHILGGVLKILTRAGQPQPLAEYRYISHYPMGKPNDNVADEVPTHIAADFREALRCRFVDAHNATVEMCRRAVQASCINLGAPADKKLIHQIDWLAAEGKITTPLKDMAHRVRLGGNLGAHPPSDPEDPDAIVIGDEYSNGVVEFTRELLDHVYVMPARMKKYTFTKPKAGADA